jgi:MFS family permease
MQIKITKFYKFYLPGNAWVLALSAAIWSIGGAIVTPFQSIYFYAVGMPTQLIGFANALSSIITAFMYLLGGYIADKWGRRKVIVIFSFVAVINNLFYFLVKDWLWLFIPIIIGAISGIYVPAFNATLNDSMEPNKRHIGFAYFLIVTTIPSIFLPTVGGLLIERFGADYGLKIGYLITTITGIAGVTYRAIKLKETFVNKENNDANRNLISHVVYVFKDNLQALKMIDYNAKNLVIYSFLSSIATSLTTIYLALYLINEANLPPILYGILIGISSLITIVLVLPSIYLIDRIGIKKAAILAALTSPISMIFFVSANGMNDLIAWSVIGGISGAVLTPTIQSLQGNLIPRNLRGRLMAVFSVFPLIISTPVQAISGIIYTTVHPLAIFIASIPFYVASIIFLSRINPKIKGYE